MKLRLILAATLVLGLTTACSGRKNYSPFPSINEESKANLDKPIDCSTAAHDIKILEEERASIGKQILSGVRSVVPFAAVAGILAGDYSDRVSVATGSYNRDIEDKVYLIRTTCSTPS